MFDANEDPPAGELGEKTSQISNVVIEGNRAYLEGEFDLSSLAALSAATAELVGRCVIDLHDATFIDASCVGALVELQNRLRQNDGDLIFVRACGSVRRVLDICGLLAEEQREPPRTTSTNGVA